MNDNPPVCVPQSQPAFVELNSIPPMSLLFVSITDADSGDDVSATMFELFSTEFSDRSVSS